MKKILLCEIEYSEYAHLTFDGQPLLNLRRQIDDLLASTMGAEAKAWLAWPRTSEEGSIAWYSESSGEVVKVTDLPSEKQSEAILSFQRFDQELEEAIEGLEHSSSSGAELLTALRNSFEEGDLYLVDTQPVMTCWGLTQLSNGKPKSSISLEAPKSTSLPPNDLLALPVEETERQARPGQTTGAVHREPAQAQDFGAALPSEHFFLALGYIGLCPPSFSCSSAWSSFFCLPTFGRAGVIGFMPCFLKRMRPILAFLRRENREVRQTSPTLIVKLGFMKERFGENMRPVIAFPRAGFPPFWSSVTRAIAILPSNKGWKGR